MSSEQTYRLAVRSRTEGGCATPPSQASGSAAIS